MFHRTSQKLVLLLALALGAGACGKDPASPDADGETVAAFVASASVDDIQGTMETTAIPRPTEGGPPITVNGHLTIVNGGTATLTITSPTLFEKVYVAASTPVSRLFVPVSGFYEVILPAPTTVADLLLTFPPSLPTNSFDLYFSAEDASGLVGTLQNRSFHALTVGSGDIQVTASWDTDADVDLHVVDPAGWEVYWADRESPSGGQLDLDSNAACAGDNVRNENITWAVGAAPHGDYSVRLDYWDACSASATNYTVLVRNDDEVNVYHGTFTGAGDHGSLGSGVVIASFTRDTGPPAAPATNPPPPARTAELLKAPRRMP